MVLAWVQLAELRVDWGPVSSWAAAVVTLLAVLVALFGWRMWDWLRRPQLRIIFEHAEPFCRKTELTNGRDGYWVRVRVENTGVEPARACIGKLTRIYTDGQFRQDMDPMQLRWCGVPDKRGFEPIHLARKQREFLDVFRIVDGQPYLNVETFPPCDYAPGFPTSLEANVEHCVEITVVADNADPTAAMLTVTYDGDFSRLPGSLKVSATARAARRP